MLNVHTDLLDLLDADETYLLLHITRHVGRNGSCFPSLRRLAELTRWSRSKVGRVRDRLVAQGVLVQTPRTDATGRNTSCLYLVNTTLVQPFNGTAPGHVPPAGQQQTLVSHPCYGDVPPVTPHEVLSREVLSIPTYLPPRAQAHEADDPDDTTASERPDALQKSCAKKGSAALGEQPRPDPAGLLDRRIELARLELQLKQEERAEREAAAARRRATPATSFDELAARHSSTTAPPAAPAELAPEDLDPSDETAISAAVVRCLDHTRTPEGQRLLQSAYARARLPADTDVNLYAAVDALIRHQVQRHRRIPSNPYGKLPRYLRTQARIDLEEQARDERTRTTIEQTQKFTHATPTYQSRRSRTPDDICSPATALAGAELALIEHRKRYGHTG